ncbi:hypothetical protein [Streptomyces canus]|uniref:hypothetical protein n=1 Tax=Streptomyces canus TaxID=58343 RepID=UPI0032433818
MPMFTTARLLCGGAEDGWGARAPMPRTAGVRLRTMPRTAAVRLRTMLHTARLMCAGGG